MDSQLQEVVNSMEPTIGLVSKIVDVFNSIATKNPIVGGIISMWILGVLTFLARNVPARITELFKKQFTVTTVIRNKDQSFSDIIKWFEGMGYGDKARTLVVSNGKWGDEPKPIISIGLGTHYIRLGWDFFKLNLSEKETIGFDVKESVSIVTLGRSQRPLRKLLKAIQPQKLDLQKTTRIYNWNTDGWTLFSEQPSRPLDSVVISDANRKELMTKLDAFINDKEFYLGHGIPYREGIEFSGPPGTGKTVLSLALCSHLERNLYKLNLSSMSDSSMEVAFASVRNNGIILIEDADTHGVLDKRDITKKPKKFKVNKPAESKEKKAETGNGIISGKNTDSELGMVIDVAAPKTEGNEEDTEAPGQTEQRASFSFLTLKGVLNAIDGVSSSDGRILIITTNDPERIDPAVRRKGRVNISITMDFLTPETYTKMFKRFFPDYVIPVGTIFQRERSAADFQYEVLCNKTDPEAVLEKFICS